MAYIIDYTVYNLVYSLNLTLDFCFLNTFKNANINPQSTSESASIKGAQQSMHKALAA